MFIILRNINPYFRQTMLLQHDQNKNVKETKQLGRSELQNDHDEEAFIDVRTYFYGFYCRKEGGT